MKKSDKQEKMVHCNKFQIIEVDENLKMESS